MAYSLENQMKKTLIYLQTLAYKNAKSEIVLNIEKANLKLEKSFMKKHMNVFNYSFYSSRICFQLRYSDIKIMTCSMKKRTQFIANKDENMRRGF